MIKKYIKTTPVEAVQVTEDNRKDIFEKTYKEIEEEQGE